MLATLVTQASGSAVQVKLLVLHLSRSLRRLTDDLDLQLAHKIRQYIAELRISKEPLQLPVILGFLQEQKSDVALGSDIQPWDVIGLFVTRLSNDVNALLPPVQQSIDDRRLVQS